MVCQLIEMIVPYTSPPLNISLLESLGTTVIRGSNGKTRIGKRKLCNRIY